MIGAFIAILFSIFVFGLCGFHTYLVQKALTTQEKLKHMYDSLPFSPFSHGRCFANWTKVICWPRIPKTRLYYMLYLKHKDKEKFDALREEKGDEILPTEMIENSIQIYEPPSSNSVDMDASLPGWQIMSSQGKLKGRKSQVKTGD